MDFMRASNKGERAFCLLFLAAEKSEAPAGET